MKNLSLKAKLLWPIAITAVLTLVVLVIGLIGILSTPDVPEGVNHSVVFGFIWVIAAMAVLWTVVYVVVNRANRALELIQTSVNDYIAGKLIEPTATSDTVLTHGPPEFQKLAEALRQTSDKRKEVFSDIGQIVDDIGEVSIAMADMMTKLSGSSTEQAAAVAQTAYTITEMENAAKSAAVSAGQIAQAAEKTAETSIRGKRAVETTSNIILQIKDDAQDMSTKSKNLLTSIEEVGNIIGFVNGIAEQSKILAVNASIEAAKAGQYGAGFAVVAQEVRDLAQQSKEATLQTTDTLNSIQKAIENMVTTAQNGETRTEESVQMISNAGAIVNNLSEAIRENSEFASFIASNVTQQTSGLSQIAIAIEQINNNAISNRATSSEMEQTIDSLSQKVTNLTDFLNTWPQVNGDQNR